VLDRRPLRPRIGHPGRPADRSKGKDSNALRLQQVGERCDQRIHPDHAAQRAGSPSRPLQRLSLDAKRPNIPRVSLHYAEDGPSAVREFAVREFAVPEFAVRPTGSGPPHTQRHDRSNQGPPRLTAHPRGDPNETVEPRRLSAATSQLSQDPARSLLCRCGSARLCRRAGEPVRVL
jgi:hypothetical protein